MKRSWVIGFAVSSSVLLAGCGGGGGGGGSGGSGGSGGGGGGADATRAQAGLYEGTISVDGQAADSILLLAPDGSIVERANGTYASGKLSFNNGSFSGPIREFVQGEWRDGTLAGTYTASSLDGQTQAAIFSFDRDPLVSDLDASLGKVSGRTWLEGATETNPVTTSITIDAGGNIVGSDGDCTFSGAISVPDASINIYETTITASGAACPAAEQGVYNGYGFVLPTAPASLVILDDNGTNNRYFVFEEQ